MLLHGLSKGLLALAASILFVWLLVRSPWGRVLKGIREDEDAAELMGVPTFTFKLWAFAIGAAVGGLAGTLYATPQRQEPLL